MARQLRNRIHRPATDAKKQRHDLVRQQIAGELPEIKRQARQQLAAALLTGVPVHRAISALRAERERQGLSLADVKDRTGIERSTLSRLENNAEANPTVDTLSRYAGAVGKQLLIVLTDAPASQAK